MLYEVITLGSFIGFLTMRIGDGPMVAGTSVYNGKLGEVVASDKFTLRSMPLSAEISSGYRITGDGDKAENSTIVAKA